MSDALKIAIIGDYNFTFNAHHATNLSLDHSSEFLEFEINYYWIERQFVGQWYYFMWPFKGIVRKMFEKQMEKIKNDDLSPEQRKVKEIIFS